MLGRRVPQGAAKWGLRRGAVRYKEGSGSESGGRKVWGAHGEGEEEEEEEGAARPKRVGLSLVKG